MVVSFETIGWLNLKTLMILLSEELALRFDKRMKVVLKPMGQYKSYNESVLYKKSFCE